MQKDTGPYKGTKVPIEKSKEEIRKMLAKYGITQTRWTEDLEHDNVMFEFILKGGSHNYMVRIIPKPFYEDHPQWDRKQGKNIKETVPNWARTYRALFYYIKSKVEATALGFHTIEEEFMPDILVKGPNDQPITLADAIMKQNLPQLDFRE